MSFHNSFQLYLPLVFSCSPFPSSLCHISPPCIISVSPVGPRFDGGCREPWKLLQSFTQLQRVQHRPGHQGGHHHAAFRRVLWPQGRRCAHPLSVGGHQLRRGPAHTDVHSHWPGGEDGGACDHRPQWWVPRKLTFVTNMWTWSHRSHCCIHSFWHNQDSAVFTFRLLTFSIITKQVLQSQEWWHDTY